jgi:hypothetical protein
MEEREILIFFRRKLCIANLACDLKSYGVAWFQNAINANILLEWEKGSIF